jgi:diadenosine tetraphosphate (Ap4A) HIT family hydrolase
VSAVDAPDAWREQRAAIARRAEVLVQQGICPSCQSLQTGEPYGNQHVLYEDDLFLVKLEDYPRARGHTIVLYKPHREDISALSEGEAARVFTQCVRVVKAIKIALGAEKVYLNTMCDGPINHLHLQLLPRYPGEPIGSTRFVAPPPTAYRRRGDRAADQGHALRPRHRLRQGQPGCPLGDG